LAQGLDDPMQNVRLAAVTGLRKLDPRTAKPALARLLLEDSVWEIRVQAARALGLTGAPEVLPVLEAALYDPNEFVRSAASHALRVFEEVREDEAPDVAAADTGP
jgi:HEAT repeat protein